jgi:hypothetical protein
MSRDQDRPTSPTARSVLETALRHAEFLLLASALAREQTENRESRLGQCAGMTLTGGHGKLSQVALAN